MQSIGKERDGFVLFLQEAIFDTFGRTKDEKILYRKKEKQSFANFSTLQVFDNSPVLAAKVFHLLDCRANCIVMSCQ